MLLRLETLHNITSPHLVLNCHFLKWNNNNSRPSKIKHGYIGIKLHWSINVKHSISFCIRTHLVIIHRPMWSFDSYGDLLCVAVCFNLQCLNPALINQNCASLFMSRKTCIVTGIQLDLPSGIPSVLLLPPTTSFIKGSYKRGFDKRPLITTRTRFFCFMT